MRVIFQIYRPFSDGSSSPKVAYAEAVFLQVKVYGIQSLTLTLELWMLLHKQVIHGLLEIAFTF